MYKVILDGQLIHDPAIDLILPDAVVTVTDGKPGIFEFTIPPANPGYDKLAPMVSMISVFKNETEIFYGRAVTIQKDFNCIKAVTCEGAMAYLMDTMQRPGEYHDITVKQFLTHILSVHNAHIRKDKKINVGNVTVTDTDDSLYRYTNYNQNTFDTINDKLVNRLGGRLVLRHVDNQLYLDYLTDYNGLCGQKIEFGVNLLDYTESLSVADIATILIPLGAKQEKTDSDPEQLEKYLTIESVNGGKDCIEAPEAIKVIGRIEKIINFDDVTEPQNLLSKGKEYLAATQFETMSLSLKAVDLSNIGVAIDSIDAGCTINVIAQPYDLNIVLPVLQRTYNLNDASQDAIEAGDTIAKDINTSIASGNKDLSNRIDQLPTQSNTLKRAKEQATEIINANADSGHISYNPAEMLIMDTDNKDTAKKIWRFNMGGLGYSKNGYKGPYGLAITMDGRIVADFITAGKLRSDIIDADNLDSIAAMIGNWYIDDGNLYTTANDSSGAERTVFMQGFRSWDKHNEDTWVYSVQKNSVGLFIVKANGNVIAQDIGCKNIAYTSDKKAKQNITSADKKFLELFNLLKPSVYQFKTDGANGQYHVGFIAQDVKTAMDCCKIKENDFAGYADMGENGLGLRYSEFIPLNTLAIKELTKRIETLERKMTNA